jgi:glucokinase
MPVLGVDLGGTNIRSGRVVAGKVEHISQNKVPQTSYGQVVIDMLVETMEQTFDQHIQAINSDADTLEAAFFETASF